MRPSGQSLLSVAPLSKQINSWDLGGAEDLLGEWIALTQTTHDVVGSSTNLPDVRAWAWTLNLQIHEIKWASSCEIPSLWCVYVAAQNSLSSKWKTVFAINFYYRVCRSGWFWKYLVIYRVKNCHQLLQFFLHKHACILIFVFLRIFFCLLYLDSAQICVYIYIVNKIPNL